MVARTRAGMWLTVALLVVAVLAGCAGPTPTPRGVIGPRSMPGVLLSGPGPVPPSEPGEIGTLMLSHNSVDRSEIGSINVWGIGWKDSEKVSLRLKRLDDGDWRELATGKATAVGVFEAAIDVSALEPAVYVVQVQGEWSGADSTALNVRR